MWLGVILTTLNHIFFFYKQIKFSTMEFLDLELVKKHLNIDEDFHDDDALIEIYCAAAEKAIENNLDLDIHDIMEDGELPQPVYISMCMLVGNLYMSRETVAPTTFVRVPDTIELLLNPYKCYYETNKCECC